MFQDLCAYSGLWEWTLFLSAESKQLIVFTSLICPANFCGLREGTEVDHSSDASFFLFVGKSEAVDEMERENGARKSQRECILLIFLDDCISFEHLGKKASFFHSWHIVFV